jgi:two-component system chemotaxis sensor kinase CheA
MIDKFKDTFKEEAFELLNNLENSLLELEDNPHNQEEVSSVFRTMHTIKGSAAMFGFQHISEFTHDIENILDLVREGKVTASKELIDLTLAARDHIRLLLNEPEPPAGELIAKSEALLEEFKQYISSVSGTEQKQSITLPEGKSIEDIQVISDDEAPAEGYVEQQEVHYDHTVIYRIRIKPQEDIFQNGTKPLMLLRELEEFGDFTCVAYPHLIPELDSIDPEKNYTFWDIILTTKKKENDIRDVFIFVEDSCELDIKVIDDLDTIDEGKYKRLGEILSERGVVDELRAEQAAGAQKKIGQILEEEGVSKSDVYGALEEQAHVERSRQRVQTEMSASSIRVSSEKLDNMVDLVGEVVTLQARLAQTANSIQHGELSAISENFERLTAELRDETMSVRMLPIGTTFSKFKRLVRDLSRDLGKEVEMLTEGGETELDKTVIERLNDPLVHIIRNSIDHGVEMPAERKAAGKNPSGWVKLSALHSGANVLIRIEDNGAGLNKEKIKEKAINKEIITEKQELSDKEIYQLIFAPGFSTAQNVTSVSGRGVGMDVVKKEIDNLGGTVDVESTSGTGTVITLKIPLTLAIIEGLLVGIKDSKYVFPLGAVEECIELKKEQKEREKERKILNNRGELLPFLRLREVFHTGGSPPDIEQIVVVNAAGEKVGFVVDNVIGDHQTVIKNLGKMYRDLEGISGATILGDGSVALILDVQKLAAKVAAEEKEKVGK